MSAAKRIGVMQARATFNKLVELAGGGAEFIVTRNGKPAAYIGPVPIGQVNKPPKPEPVQVLTEAPPIDPNDPWARAKDIDRFRKLYESGQLEPGKANLERK